MELNYHLKAMTRAEVPVEQSGTADWQDAQLHVVLDLPEPVSLLSVRAWFPLAVGSDQRLFFNGYQSETHSPEYKRYDQQKGLGGLQETVLSYYGLDHRGDYFITGYPNRKGILHGYSWCWIRSGDTYQLFASLDETNGYTVFTYDAEKQEMTVSRDCMNVEVQGSWHAFDLFTATGSEEEVFNAWFAALQIKPRTSRQLCGYATGWDLGTEVSAQGITERLDALEEMCQPGDLILIDAGWQTAIGDWTFRRDRFPQGLQPVVQAIHERGFQAGLALAPFIASARSALSSLHSDWFLKAAGKNWRISAEEDGCFSLDFQNPAVRSYLQDTFETIFQLWGFDLVKCEALYAGAPFGTKEKSRAAVMSEELDFLRECCQDHPILACQVPLMPAFGKVEYCSVVPDLSLSLDDPLYMRKAGNERASTRNLLENAWNRRMLNERAFLNDNNVLLARHKDLKLSTAEVEKLCISDALLAGTWLSGENPNGTTPEILSHYRRLRRFTTAEDKQYHCSEHGPVVTYRIGDAHNTVLL